MMSQYNTIQKKDEHVNDIGSCKIAIVHDFLVYHGGAERVLRELIDMYPTARVYTLLYDKQKMDDWFGHVDVQTSFLQKWPQWIKKHHRWLIPFYGTAVESFDLRDFDLIISSSGAWSKGIVTRLHTKHIAYVHSPMRYVWDENEHYLKKNPGPPGRGGRPRAAGGRAGSTPGWRRPRDFLWRAAHSGSPGRDCRTSR